MADIFVSYAREDRDAIRTLAARLTRTGWTVWWDRHILAGKDFDDVLQAELDKARCVLVAWSAHSVASRWVKVEAGEGLRREILVPVQLDAALPPLGFRNIQTVAFTGLPLDADTPAFDDLVEALTALVGPPAPASEAATRVMEQPPARARAAPPAPPEPVRAEPAGPDLPATPDPESSPRSPLLPIAGMVVVVAIAAYFLLPFLKGRDDRSSGETTAAAPPVAASVKQESPPAPLQPPPARRTEADDKAAALLTDAALRDFAAKMIEAAASGDAGRLLPFYADRVDYYALGPVGLDEIRKDKEAYYRRWPIVKLQLEGDITIENGALPATRRVRFATTYEVSDIARGAIATGTTTTTLLVAVADGALKVVDHKETARTSRQ